MPDLTGMEAQDPSPLDIPEPEPLEFTVLSQTLQLEIDFPTRTLEGTAIFEIQPWAKDLRYISMNARQCKIDVKEVTVDGRSCKVDWEDRYKRIAVPDFFHWTADNWSAQQEKIDELVKNTEEPELTIHLPQGFVIREEPLGALSSIGADIGAALAANSTSAPNSDTQYLPIRISVPFSAKNFRDGLHFAGLDDSDRLYRQYPHMYTKQSSTGSGISRCIFPCFDNTKVKPLWTISIKCGRTLGDALIRQPTHSTVNGQGTHGATGLLHGSNGKSVERATESNDYGLGAEDKLLEMFVVCSGDFIKDEIDPADTRKKIVTYELAGNMVYAGHIGFSVGPFEYVDLSSVSFDHRAEEENVKLGQTAVKVNGWCLPGRGSEVHTAAHPLARAVDHFCITYGAYPFKEYTVCFVGDQIQDTVDTASMTLCSDRLLFAEDMIDPVIPVARKLVHALARQYMGVSILPGKPKDSWIVVGIAHFLKDSYMRELGGINEFHYNLKQRADRVMELDVQRPSLYELGATLNLGPFELEFMELKAPLVLHMLDRRISKDPNHAITGLNRIISKTFTMVNTGGSTDDSRTLTTTGFEKTCEKFCKNTKLVEFFRQWVYQSGYPRFSITQKFDKKNFKIKLTVRQTQSQKQESVVDENTLSKSEFEREYKEHINEVYASDVPPYFTGSMSIRVHEADGTPYEHTFTIDSKEKTIDIPYNTKYKRIRRDRKQKEREAASKGDANLDGVDELLYCLGDNLQSDAEINDWGIRSWDQATLLKMENDSFEWISIDADHEWRISVIDQVMEPHMWVSQLQQDRDVVAHINAVNALAKLQPSGVIASVLTRTVMDHRYFHGVRTLAVESLPAHAWVDGGVANFQMSHIFLTLFCYEGRTGTPRPNNFTKWANYFVQSAVVTSLPKLRYSDGSCPLAVQQFLLTQLTLNDNSENEFSDCQYVGRLVEALTDAMIPKKPANNTILVVPEEDEDPAALEDFRQKAIEEIVRYLKNDMTTGSDDNIFTQKCLESKLKLMQAGIITPNPAEFLKYLHPDTLDIVQVTAMSAAVELGVLSKSNGVIQLMLHLMSTNGSPFLRDQFFKIFWEGLASIAFGEYDEKSQLASRSAQSQERPVAGSAAAQGQEPPVPGHDQFKVVEAQEQSEARQAHIARTTTVEGAVKALKAELNDNLVLKHALWEAVKSQCVTLGEQATLLEFCKMLYDNIHTFRIKLRYPRYYEIQNLGKVDTPHELVSYLRHQVSIAFSNYSNTQQGKLVIRRTEKPRVKMPEKVTPDGRPVAPPPPPKKIKVINGGVERALVRPSVQKVAGSTSKNPVTAASSRNTQTITAKVGESASLNSTATSQLPAVIRPAIPSVLKGRPSKIVKLKFKNKNVLARFKPAGSIKLKLNHLGRTMTNSPVPNSATGKSSPVPNANLATPISSGGKPMPAVQRTPLPDRRPLPDGRPPLPNGRPVKRPLVHDNQEDDSPRPSKIVRLKLRIPK